MLVKIVGRIGGDLAKISGLTGAVEDEEIVAVIRSEAHLMKKEKKAETKKKEDEQKR